MDDLSTAQDSLVSLLDGLSPTDWVTATPCPGWDVAAVVRHLAVGEHAFATSLAGTAYDLAAISTAFAPVAPVDLAATYAEESAALRVALAGAGTESFPTGLGPMGAVAIGEIRGLEALVHGWDVATGTGRTLRVDDGVAERALGWAEALVARLPPDRTPFGSPQPVAPTAAPLDRLVARLGRSVS